MNTEQMKALLVDGVGERTSAAEVKVAVIGAGMAGLVAAFLLLRAKIDVTIFEASHRVGGRIKTVRDGFTQDLYAEVGAMRIPAAHELTLYLCERFGLELIDFVEDCDNAWIYLNGQHCRRSDYLAGNANLRQPYSASRTAEAMVQEVLQPITPIYLEGLQERPTKRQSELFRRLDSISWGEYLRLFLKDNAKINRVNPVTGKRDLHLGPELTWGDIDLIRCELGAAEFRTSLMEFIRDESVIVRQKGKKQIAGGMDRLPLQFVKYGGKDTLAGRIRYHARVHELKQVEGSARYQIRYENPLTHAPFPPEQFDHVVLTAPFSALTHVRLDPLPPEIRHAIRTLHYENASKIVLEFSEPFWEKGRLPIRGGKSFSDLPIRWTHYPSPEQWTKCPHRLLLASYTWGDDSLRWGPLSEEDRIRFALRDIAELHQLPLDDCRQKFVGGISHNWARDEYSFGAFSVFEPHQETELYKNICKPYQKIHFAGEHTSLKHAWIEGAVESGIRVAKEVFDIVERRA